MGCVPCADSSSISRHPPSVKLPQPLLPKSSDTAEINRVKGLIYEWRTGGVLKGLLLHSQILFNS